MMKKWPIFFLLIWVTISFCSTASATIYYYSGTMDASFAVEDSIEISIPAGLTEFIYNYPIPQTYDYGVNSQSIVFPQLAFSPTPETSTTKTDEFGNQYVRLVWRNPSPGTITGTVTYSTDNTADWDKFTTSDLFPLDSNLVQEMGPFMEATEQVQSDNNMITSLASSLTDGLDQEWKAVLAICGWVMDNITYGQNQNVDAVSTYSDRVGVCTNFSHLSCAILRAAGIPARYVTGYSLSKPYTLPYNGGSFTSIDWGQGSHAWIEIYYPSLGWIPYDPQRDLHHIDTHRISYGAGKDNDSLIAGSSQWYYTGNPPDAYPTITKIPTINWISDNINLTFVKESDEINDFAFSSSVNFVLKDPADPPLSLWKLISLPLTPADTSTGTVLAGIANSVVSVWTYDQTNGWQSYFPGGAGNDLTEMTSGKGYWINMTSSETINATGSAPQTAITLDSGWNLVGYGGTDSTTVSTSLSGLDYISIWAYDQTNGWISNFKDGVGNDLLTLEKGRGYWINMNQSATWNQ